MSLILDGTNGLTFNNATTQNSGGKVIQVVQTNISTQTSTGTTSFVTTGLTATITPLFSTSKILISVAGVGATGLTNTGVFTIYKNGSNLLTANGFAQIFNTGGSFYVSIATNYLDSPATTSATTYAVYFNTNNSNVYFAYANSIATINLMEVAA